MEERFLREFIGLTDEDAQDVAEVGRILSEAVGLNKLVDMVYDRLLSWPETARFFEGQDIGLRRLTLTQYLARLVEGPYGFDYAAKHTEVGRRHLNVEVPLEYLIATYGWVRSLLPTLVVEATGGDSQRAARLIAAFNKALDYDLCLLTAGYSRSQAPIASQ
jgi:truncated hemoglobin YjbI